MKFEVQFQINFVVFFVRHKFSIIPHLEKINDYGLSELFNINLKEFLLLNIFECVHELTISLLRYYRDPLCNKTLIRKVIFENVLWALPLRNVG